MWVASIFAAPESGRDKVDSITYPDTHDSVLKDRVLVIVLASDAVADAEFDWRSIQRQCYAFDLKQRRPRRQIQ